MLAVKLAKEAFFGDAILARCTVIGEHTFFQEVNELKTVLFHQFPQYWKSKHEFESMRKACVESVGLHVACKRLRSKQFE